MSQMCVRTLTFLVRGLCTSQRVHSPRYMWTHGRRSLSQITSRGPPARYHGSIATRNLSTQSHLCQTQKDNSQRHRSDSVDQSTDASIADKDEGDRKEETQYLGIFKRFKDAYKEHGKVLVGVHLVTSAMWTGVFYYAASSGLDVTPLLIKLGASDKVVQYLSSSVGNLATTYVMYKIATPARYTVTIFGTYTTVRYLRKWGYITAPAKEDRIRHLVKEKYTDMKDDVKEKYVDMKDDVKDKYGDMKGDMKQKLKAKVGIKKKEL